MDNLTSLFPHNPYLKQSKLRQIFESAPKNSINLGLGQPGEDTPLFIREAASRVALTKNLGYTLNAGILELREILAAEQGIPSISAKNIVLTTGVQEALYALFYTLLDKENTILLPDPGFLTYPALSNLKGSKPEYYSLNKEHNFRFEAEAVLKSISPSTRAVLLAHPSNPTGSLADKEELVALVHGLKKLNRPIWIISDEVYFGMSYDQSSDSMIDFWEDYPYLVVLRGASKSHHMTGWRLGWAFVPDSLVTAYVASHQYVCTCASALTQFTFLEIRGSSEESNWLEFQKKLYREKRDLVKAELQSYRKLFGGEGAFYWMLELNEDDLAGYTDEHWVLNTMKSHLVTTTPGSAFGNNTNGMIRISYGPKTDSLKEGLSRLKDSLS